MDDTRLGVMMSVIAIALGMLGIVLCFTGCASRAKLDAEALKYRPSPEAYKVLSTDYCLGSTYEIPNQPESWCMPEEIAPAGKEVAE